MTGPYYARLAIVRSDGSRETIERRRAGAPDKPNVSYTALLGIVDRECNKQGRRWYGVPSAYDAIQEIRAADPDTRKIARQMMLDRIEAFPVRPTTKETQ